MWISQKLFLDRKSVSPDVSDYLGWRHMNVSSIVGSLLESCSSSIKPSDLLEIEESVSNSRIWGQDKPIFLLLKPFSSNKWLFNSRRHAEFSNFADVSGTGLPFSWHLKITQLKLTNPKGCRGRLPLCPIFSWLRAYPDIIVHPKRAGLALRYVIILPVGQTMQCPTLFPGALSGGT